MTPSEKPERSDSPSTEPDDANRSSVITHSVEETAETTTAASAGGTTTGGATSASAEDSPPDQDSGNADETGPPPWQRSAASTSGSATTATVTAEPTADASSAAGSPGAEDTQNIPKPDQDPDTVRTEMPAGVGASQAGRSSVSFSGETSTRSTPGAGTSARRPSRGPRRASLQVKRVDPWSVLKLALVLSVALFFVWLIAVAVLYGVLDGMGVWDQLNGTFSELTRPDDAASDPLISAGRVFGVATIIGAINIVLWTALATVGAFIYNVAADFAGGVEVTLSERE